MSEKTCTITKIDNGFLIQSSSDPNDYNQAYDYEHTFTPVVRKTVFAGSPEGIVEIVGEFYAEQS